ncbi:MAG TPA: hypothetical protein VHH52_04010 [Pseudonocardiaceae bacterium]|jgi:hypothetical protein|nr:hypothetical protein [Pseudonocardiaceae bacterium]
MAAQPDSALGCALASLVPLMRRTGTAVAVAGIDNPAQVQWWQHRRRFRAWHRVRPAVAQQDIPGLLHSRVG